MHAFLCTLAVDSLTASRRCLIAVALAALTACAGVPPVAPVDVPRGDYSAASTYATRLVQRTIANDKVQGVSIALVVDQQVVWSQGFGYAEAETRQPATADTIYRVGSISKLFTDAAALQLAERGKLDLDEPIGRRLPGFTPRSWTGSSVAITPRMLMTHHSGLQRDVAKSFQSARPPRFTELTEHFDSYLSYDPGQILSYSNVGLTVLGTLVERVSGQPFEAQQRASLLEPLGMAHSAFDAAVSPSPDMAKSYQGKEPLAAIPLRDVPAGGLNSSVNDLGRFMRMLFADGRFDGRQILRPESIKEMFRPQNAAVPLDLDTRVGLGWFLQSPDKAQLAGGGWLAEHAAAIDGYRSSLVVLPEHKLGVVILASSTTANASIRRIALQVLSVALQARAGIRQPVEKTAELDETAVTPAFVDKPLESAILDRWVGDYTTSAGLVRITSDDRKSLQVEAFGVTARLRERIDGQFGLSYRLLSVIPIDLGTFGRLGFSRRTIDGRDVLVASNGPREALAGQRLPNAPLPADLRSQVERHLGEYEVVDQGDAKIEVDSVRLLQERERFIAEVGVTSPRQTIGVPLKPLNEAQTLALGVLADRGDMIETVPDPSGAIEVRAVGLTLRRTGAVGQ